MSKADAPDLAGQGPAVDRRTFLKTVGAGAGAATVGTGAIDSPLTATQDAEAAVVSLGMLVGGAALVGIGAIGGMKLANWNDEDVEINEDDLSNDRETATYEVATLLRDGFDNYDKIAQGEFSSSGNDSFSDSAWSEIRTIAAKGVKEGWSRAKAKRLAGQAVDKQATRFFLNHIQLWNRRVEAFLPYMADDINDSNKDTIAYHDRNYDTSNIRTPSGAGVFDPADFDGWEGITIDEAQVGMKLTGDKLDLPWDPTQFEEWDQDDSPEVLGVWKLGPNIPTQFLADGVSTSASDRDERQELIVSHSSFDNTVVFDGTYGIQAYMAGMWDDYNDLTDDVATYVDTVYDGIAQGAITEIDLLSPKDLVDQFSSADEMSRSTAELAAAGLHAPAEAGGVLAKVSHPNLQADSLWVRLFIRWSGDPQPVEPGASISSYELAVATYQNQGTQEPEAEVWRSGTIEVLEVSGEGVDQSENIDQTTEEDGTVPVWDPEKDGEPPEWIKNPPAGETITVTTPDGTYSFDPTQLKQREDGMYVIPGTSIPAGKNIKTIRTAGSLEYIRPYSSTPDPTTIDEQRLKERYGAITQFRDLVREEAVNSGGGGVGGDWINQIIGFFGGIKNAVVAAIVVVVGASAIGALNG